MELVLKHSNLDEPVVIQADVSDVAVDAILLQKNAKGELQPCAYMFCKLSDTERHWAIWDKEAYTVQWVLLTWRQFLEDSKIPFEVWTHYKNLEALKTTWKLSPKQVRWAPYFNHFSFNLHYLPGGENLLADALWQMLQ